MATIFDDVLMARVRNLYGESLWKPPSEYATVHREEQPGTTHCRRKTNGWTRPTEDDLRRMRPCHACFKSMRNV